MNNVTWIKSADARKRKAALSAKLRDASSLRGHRDELYIEHFADPLDQIRSGLDREIVVNQLDQQTRSIHDVQAALAKIGEGTYGLCEQCEEPISAKRLDAVPWARLCVSCQSSAEARTGGHAVTFHAAA
jgi:RNA polymerase-binding protein DksA